MDPSGTELIFKWIYRALLAGALLLLALGGAVGW